MTVIRTTVRRKLIKASIPFAVTAAAAFTVAFAVPRYAEPIFAEKRTAEIGNMNDCDDSVPFMRQEEQLSDSSENEAEDTSVPDNFNEERDAGEETAAVKTSVVSFDERYLLTRNVSDEKEDLSLFTLHSGAIYEQNFGRGNGPEYIELEQGAQLRNCTEIENEVVERECSYARDIAVELYSDEPQVLILHTHTTESYEPYIKDWYDERYTSRSFDPDNSVVSVGEAIAEQLAASGITVIHDCTVHDAVYNGAYKRSLETAVSILDEYPSIKIVLDIHRDAIELGDGTRVSAVTEIDGKKAAQIMIICAADDGTYDVPAFYNNLHFACGLQESIEGMFPSLTRPILFQYCQYNQQVSGGALLIEVGSHGNSIDEAVYSGELIGKSLAAMLKENAVEPPPEAVPVIAGMPMYFLERIR